MSHTLFRPAPDELHNELHRACEFGPRCRELLLRGVEDRSRLHDGGIGLVHEEVQLVEGRGVLVLRAQGRIRSGLAGFPLHSSRNIRFQNIEEGSTDVPLGWMGRGRDLLHVLSNHLESHQQPLLYVAELHRAVLEPLLLLRSTLADLKMVINDLPSRPRIRQVHKQHDMA
jgi:hypothetical protein